MKNKTIAAFVLAYVLLGSIFSVIPTYADNHFTTIESILNDSKNRIDEKFADFESKGLEIPQDADSLYNEGLAKYDEAIALLNSGDFENAKEPGLEALSLFEDAYKAIFEAEEELAEEQEEYIGDLFEIAESIAELENEADEIRDLISINELDISLDDYDSTILLATENYINGDLKESEKYIESAEDILDKILDQIEYKAEEDQDKRVKEFVENLLADLQDVISTASELGVDESVIIQLQILVDGLTDYDSTSDIFEITGASSDHESALSVVDEKIPKVELEAELVVDGTDEDAGEAKFEQRGDDRKELEVEIEDQDPDAVFEVFVIDDEDTAVFVGMIEIDEDGDGELKLEFKDGAGDTVPSIMVGDSVEIIGDNGVVILGIFAPHGSGGEVSEPGADEVSGSEEEEVEFEGTITDIVKNTSFDLLLEDGITTVTILTDNTSGLAMDDEVKVEAEATDVEGIFDAIEIEVEDYEGVEAAEDAEELTEAAEKAAKDAAEDAEELTEAAEKAAKDAAEDAEELTEAAEKAAKEAAEDTEEPEEPEEDD